MTIKEKQELLEEQTLSPFACFSKNSKGRDLPITPCEIRTEFQRDRDRIIHSKAFRRMKHKTQVFLLPDGDHYRTRLTHTLEVSQIARTIACGLRLNEDLTEAMALGHDLGHTPFGHAGEDILNELLPDGFEHNKQSIRVVEVLENLNLTFEVRDGILNHRKSGQPQTLEGRILYYADRIAYLNHDIDDAVRGGVLCEESLPRECVRILGASHGERINNMILDVIHESENRSYISMSEDFEFAMNRLREYMFQSVYTDPVAKAEEKKAEHVIKGLYHYYLDHPATMSPEFVAVIYKDGPERAVADYISCMTDRFAIAEFEKIFVPKGWKLF